MNIQWYKKHSAIYEMRRSWFKSSYHQTGGAKTALAMMEGDVSESERRTRGQMPKCSVPSHAYKGQTWRRQQWRELETPRKIWMVLSTKQRYCSLLPRENCKLLRVSPGFSMILVHCCLTKVVSLNWKKEQAGRGKETSNPVTRC